MTATVDVGSGHGLSLELFDAKAKELGHAVGKQMFEGVIGAVGEAVAETGNTLKLKKGGFTQEDVLKMIDMPASGFDEAGKSTMTLVFGPELAEELRAKEKEWSNDPVFRERLGELEERKRREFNEREARRRLVD